METDHPLQNYFLPRYYSIVIPVSLGVILLGIIGEWVITSDTVIKFMCACTQVYLFP